MNIFSIDLTPNEISFIRQSLDGVTIKGVDAKFLANLQVKLENELVEIQKMMEKEERKKVESLQTLIQTENVKSSKKS